MPTPTPPPLKIAVIGAGYAGCAAAVALADRGAAVTVFERSRVAGGRARAVESDQAALDNGQHILVGAYRETLALMRRVGRVPEQQLLRLPLDLQLPGLLHLKAPKLPGFLAPVAALIGLLRAQGLDRADKLAALRLVLALRLGRALPRSDESVLVWLQRLQQTPRLRQLLWLPLCVATLNTPAHEASAHVFATVLRDTLAGPAGAADLLLPRCDLGEMLPRPALDHVQSLGGTLRLACPIQAIQPLPKAGYRLVGDGWSEDFDRVILATAPYHALNLLPADRRLDPECRSALAAFRFEPIVTCYLGYDLPVSLPGAMIGLEEGKLCQWLFDRSRILRQSGPTRSVVAAVISASGPHQALYREHLAATAHAELQTVAGPLPAPLWHQVITEKRATFACRPGVARPPAETGLPGLLLAGDYLDPHYPATLETAVRSGLLAAEKLLSLTFAPVRHALALSKDI